MTFQNTTDAIRFISNSSYINYEDSFDLSKYCSQLLRTKELERDGRDIVIRVKDAWNKLEPNTKNIWNDLTEAAGLYPYVESENLSHSALLRYEYHRSPFINDVFLHEEQQILSIQLQSQKAVVVSAPTSFGKSLLIEEVIASKIYSQVVVIQPTLALLDETRKKLLKYRDDYKLVVSTNQLPDTNKGNIFLFTGERVVEYEHFSSVDFFVIDEFYKLSLERDDDRAISLNQAFHRLLRFTNKFYLLGPMIKSIPLTFKNKFELLWFPTEFSTVAVDEINFEIKDKLKATERKIVKRNNLFKYLLEVREQTLIYCSSPNRATTLGIEFADEVKSNEVNILGEPRGENEDLIEWITQNINPNWSLIDALKTGVAFHHGALPRHLGSSIVDLFNAGTIRWLFCTSTLIEGVNTSAKNVVLFDKEKGTKQIDFFDYKNISGRSGRMKKHFIGNVVRFEKQPDQMELFVDIPLFDQENAPLEILITLDESEIESTVRPKLENYNNFDEDLKSILKRNASLSIDGQLKIIEAIEENIEEYSQLLGWTSYPTYDQLLAVIGLAWAHLLKRGENQADIRSAAHLTVLTIKYSQLKSISAVISNLLNDNFWIAKYPNRQTRVNVVTFFILNITRHWFDYKLPKWLSVVSSLQEYVFKKHNLSFGNYTFFATSLEHSFLPTNMAALTEYDIPTSAISKLQRFLSADFSPEMLISQCNAMSDAALKKRGLVNYEIKKIRNAF